MRDEVRRIALEASGFLDDREGMRLYELARRGSVSAPVRPRSARTAASPACISAKAAGRRAGTRCSRSTITVARPSNCRASPTSTPRSGTPTTVADDPAAPDPEHSPRRPRRLGDSGRGDSRAVGRHWPDATLSLVFIDGGHAEEDAMADYSTWSRCVRPGGLPLRARRLSESGRRRSGAVSRPVRGTLGRRVGARRDSRDARGPEAPVSTASAIRSARRLGSFPRPRTNSWTMIGQDGGQSIDLGERTLIVFADTLLMPTGADGAPEHRSEVPQYAAGFGERSVFLANCAAVLDGARPPRRPPGAQLPLRLSRLSDRDPRADPARARGASALLAGPRHPDGRWRLRLLPRIETLDPRDPWAFRNVGVGLARLDPESDRRERIRLGGEWCLWAPRSDDFHFGVQGAARGSRPVRVRQQPRRSRCQRPPGQGPRRRHRRPRRIRLLRPGPRGVVRDVESAGSLGPCGSDYSVSFNSYLGKYLMVYVDAFSKELAVRFADRPEGPYSVPETRRPTATRRSEHAHLPRLRAPAVRPRRRPARGRLVLRTALRDVLAPGAHLPMTA
jgi:hypothetical protein